MTTTLDLYALGNALVELERRGSGEPAFESRREDRDPGLGGEPGCQVRDAPPA